MSLQFEELSSDVIAAASEVHRHLGPGLLESTYEECLAVEFGLRQIPFLRQVELPVIYKSIRLPCGYRIDFIVDDRIVLELKSVAAIEPVHEAQPLTYLRLSQKRLGPLINFNVPLLKQGIIRRILQFHPPCLRASVVQP